MIIEDVTQFIGSDVLREMPVRGLVRQQSCRQRDATVAPSRPAPTVHATATTVAAIAPARALVAPYAHAPLLAQEHVSWRAQLARRWLQWHLGLGMLALAGGAALVATAAAQMVGIIMIAFACVVVALVAVAMIFARYDAPIGAAILALTADLVATMVGIALIGPRLETLVLLPGSLLITALLADSLFFVIAGGVLGIIAYSIAALLAQFGVIHPIVAIDPTVMGWVDTTFTIVGLTLLLVAITLVIVQFRRALANAAATEHRLQVLERRTRAKRAVLDADAIALQTEIARTLRGAASRQVTTCEELMPLATMINAMSARLPKLLSDREERLRLEKAIRELATTIETAWAGFGWNWPTPTGTTVDRIVTMLRPTNAPVTPH